ncbi:MAG TPA: type III pantothenate kinase [Nitrospiraceae bacterium]|nr:type III pantothenate kinase [Nitrospiraceae bacterium]
MLLAIDIGNSNIVWGIFEGRSLLGHWRLATDQRRTDDEYGMLFLALLKGAGYEASHITGAILSSVVPMLTPTFETMVQTYFRRIPLIVTSEIDSGLTLRYANPREIGSDRIVNAAAAHDRYHADLIIVDFGTATTFCVVTKLGEYQGGVIAPGLGISADALFARTAKLPKVEIMRPKSVVGQDTVSGIQSGLVFGYVGLVEGILRRMEQELAYPCRVIATGGLAPIVARETASIHEVRPLLTLEGLELLYRRTAGASS